MCFITYYAIIIPAWLCTLATDITMFYDVLEVDVVPILYKLEI